MKQKEIRNVFMIRNAESVDGEMYLEGISEPGAPNKRGLMLDAETSWPHIQAYIQEFQDRTEGASMGALRAMHDAHREIGKVVEVNLGQSPAIPVRVHVVSEEAKKFVEARVLNAFSWNWAVVGTMWEDKDASKKYGKKIMRYTGRPIELSLVDAPGIPETGFTVVANFDEEETMSEPNEAPAVAEVPNSDPAPVAPEVPAAPVVEATAPAPVTVENGLYTAGQFGEALEGLAYIQRVISGEERAEGDTTEIPDDLKAAIGEVAKVYAKYAAAQASELIDAGKDVDAFDMEDEDVENADGKKFSHFAAAHKASVKAHASEDADDHEAAAGAHKRAAIESEKAGKVKMAKYHRAQQKAHKAAVANCNNGDQVANADAAILQRLNDIDARCAALETARSVANSDKPDAPAKPAPVAVFHDPDQGGTVKNGDIDTNGMSLEELRAHRAKNTH